MRQRKLTAKQICGLWQHLVEQKMWPCDKAFVGVDQFYCGRPEIKDERYIIYLIKGKKEIRAELISKHKKLNTRKIEKQLNKYFVKEG